VPTCIRKPRAFVEAGDDQWLRLHPRAGGAVGSPPATCRQKLSGPVGFQLPGNARESADATTTTKVPRMLFSPTCSLNTPACIIVVSGIGACSKIAFAASNTTARTRHKLQYGRI
jgi:hypothetical protein